MNESFIPALGSSVSNAEYDFVDQWVLNERDISLANLLLQNRGMESFHGCYFFYGILPLAVYVMLVFIIT